MKRINLFIALALGLPVLYWLLIVAIDKGHLDINPESGILGFIRGYLPTIAAVTTILITSGKEGLSKFWKKTATFKAAAKTYLIIIFSPLIINALVVVILPIIEPGILEFESINPIRFIAIYFIFIFLDGPLGEELGWRGYLLPKVLERFNPIVASIFVGFIWFLWHIPLYATDGRDLTTLFLFKYWITITGHSVLYTYAYLKLSNKVVFAVLLHTSLNYFIFFRNSLVPSVRETSVDNTIYTILVVSLAILLSYLMIIKKSPYINKS